MIFKAQKGSLCNLKLFDNAVEICESNCTCYFWYSRNNTLKSGIKKFEKNILETSNQVFFYQNENNFCVLKFYHIDVKNNTDKSNTFDQKKL